MQTAIVSAPASSKASAQFPRDQWYVAGFASELKDQPLARTFLNEKIVMFRAGDGTPAALEDRCCHRSLPLSCGTVEAGGVRCGYHGMLYAPDGKCVEVPGQDRVPSKAKVKSYPLVEQNHILWIWMPSQDGSQPASAPPVYPWHDHAAYKWGSGHFFYNAPWQLIHDNLLDLSHLGYVHLKTIGGNARLHMNAQMNVTQEGDIVKVVRKMPGSTPPPTYTAAWPFGEQVDRWQEIEFHLSHLRIWTGACEPGTFSLDDPSRGGFHMRGFHGITPSTADTCHYFWSMAANKHPDMPDNIAEVVDQTQFTFGEDRGVIEQQWSNMLQFGDRAEWVDIHVDAGANRARRIVQRLVQEQSAPRQQEHKAAMAA